MLVIPFHRFLAGLAVITPKLQLLQTKLRYYNLPVLSLEELMPFKKYLTKLKLLDNKAYADFKQFFVKKEVNLDFARLLRLQQEPTLSRIANAAAILNCQPQDLGVNIPEGIFSRFQFYFMDTSRMDILSWNKYLSYLSQFDQRLYKAAIDGDKKEVLWLLGRIPRLNEEDVINDILSMSYYQFKTLMDMDSARLPLKEKSELHALAIRYADLCLKASQAKQKGKEKDTGEDVKKWDFELVFKDKLNSVMEVEKKEVKEMIKDSRNVH